MPMPYPGSGGAMHYPPSSPSRAPARRVDEMEWPTPDQLPLPSSFPLPPHVLPRPPPASVSSHHRGSGYELFPPPPLPPWWFMAALQQGHSWGAVAPPRSVSHRSSSSSSSSANSGSSDSASESRSSSPVSSHRHRQATGSLTPPTQRDPPSHHQRQQQQRYRPAAPAGTVETPTPLPRTSRTSTSTTTTTSTTNNSRTVLGTRDGRGVKEAPAARSRAMPSGDSIDSAFDVRRPSPGGPLRKEHAPPPPLPPQEVVDDEEHEGEAEVHRRMQHVVSTAESYLSHIEELYHRLRHRYEEVLLSPVKTTPVRTADGAERPPTQKAAYQTHGGTGEYLGDHTSSTSSPAPFSAAPTRTPSRTHSPAPYRLSTSAAAAAAAASAAPATISSSAPASDSQSLRHELAMLESQWLRLEEMKQHGVGLGAVHASSAQSPSIMSTRGDGGGGAVTSSSAASGKGSVGGRDFFSNQSVMELINDRKHLLASAA